MSEDNDTFAKGREAYVNTGPLQFTLRELHSILSQPRFWIGMFAVIVVLAASGPFGTGKSLAFPARFFYWMVISIATFVIGYAVSSFLSRAVEGLRGPALLSRLIGAAIAGLPIAGFVEAFNALGFAMGPDGPVAFLALAGSCSAISDAVVLLYSLIRPPVAEKPMQAIHRASNGAASQEAIDAVDLCAPAAHESPEPPGRQFFRRLTKPIGRDLVSLQAQDHYIEVVTTGGRELLLLRLGDAEAELAGYRGVRTHRSWWVALDHVREVVRSDGRVGLFLSDGRIAPVSRGYRDTVEAALAAMSAGDAQAPVATPR